MQAVLQQLQNNMQLIYRKGIDADKALQQLKLTGKGKHQAIFSKQAGFIVSSTQFSPYIEELALKIAQLEQLSDDSIKQALPEIVKQIELMLATLEQFKHSLKS